MSQNPSDSNSLGISTTYAPSLCFCATSMVAPGFFQRRLAAKLMRNMHSRVDVALM